MNDPNNLFLINWNAGKHIIFKTNLGYISELFPKNVESISSVIWDYFQEIGHTKLYRKDKIQFIYNCQKMIYGENTTIGQYFLQESNPIIFVNDVYNLFSINWDQTRNIIFQDEQNYKHELSIRNEDNLDCLLKKYLFKIDHTELIDKKDEIKYFYNLQPIQFGDKTTVGEFFLYDCNPVIYVTDIYKKIKYISVTFKTTLGNIFKTEINYKRTLGHLLMKYLFEIDHLELIDRNDKIQFLCNAQQIQFGDKTIIGEFFHNEKNPIILVTDINNLLSNNSLQKKNVKFDTTRGKMNNLIVNHGTTIENLIKLYLYREGGLELIDNYYSKKNIKFTFNGGNIDTPGLKTKTVEKIFKNNFLPKIKVDY